MRLLSGLARCRAQRFVTCPEIHRRFWLYWRRGRLSDAPIFAAVFPGLGKGGFSVRAGRSPASRKKEKPGRCAGLALPPCAVSGADQAERTHKRQAPALPAADRPNTDGGETDKQQAADAERRGNDQRKLPRDQRADRVQDLGQQQISHLEQHKVHAADRMAVRKRRGTGRKIGNEAKQAQIGERCHSPVF